MNEISTNAQPTVVIKHTLPLEVTPAPFVPLESVRHLNVDALSKESHAEIEVGYFDTGCRQMVRAVVEDGIVVEVKVDPCPEAKMEPAPPEMMAMLQAAYRAVRKGRPERPFKPMPLARFLNNQGGVTVDTITCVQICIWGFCFVCCTTRIPNAPIWCGDRVIIVRDPAPTNP
jgi:hypothetical protein